MDKKFNYTENSISMQNKSFKIYLRDFLLDNDSWNLLMLISKQTDVYIFSGVIRNFLLGISDNRDLDIVIRDLDNISIPRLYLKNIFFERNSFGGYKLKVGMLKVDVWSIEKTWGIQNLRLKDTPNSLIRTAFFNFSSIVYDFNKSKFIFDHSFLEFYKTKAMDIKYGENPNIPLCIINTFYYSLKYSFPIKYKLCKWIVTNYDEDMNFEDIQSHHFKRILFTDYEIKNLINICLKSLPALRKNKLSNVLLIKKNLF